MVTGIHNCGYRRTMGTDAGLCDGIDANFL